MNKLTLSAAVAALSLALPALAVPAAAQTKDITIGITVTTYSIACGSLTRGA